MLNPRGRLPRPVVLALCLLIVGLLGATDLLTGFELSFSIFYLLPVSLATLFGGRAEGLVTALVSAGVWLVADLRGGHSYSHWLIPYWNSAMRLGYFTLHSTLLDRLVVALRRHEELSGRDPLTGAANWRKLRERASLEIERGRRSGGPLTFCYIDLDNFKAVNDTYGHEAGDDLLRTLVGLMQARVRSADVVARVGGDELALLLPETGYEAAHLVLERLRAEALEAMARRGWPVTLSVGAVTFAADPDTVEAMVKRADGLMYEIKRGRKNGMRHVEWPPADGGADPAAEAR